VSPEAGDLQSSDPCGPRTRGSPSPTYGECYQAGESIASAFVEFAVDQVVSTRTAKQQQLRWAPAGAHLLLQTRTRTRNGDPAAAFRAWYPPFGPEDQEVADEERPSATEPPGLTRSRAAGGDGGLVAGSPSAPLRSDNARLPAEGPRAPWTCGS
jgi:hypothetical protein